VELNKVYEGFNLRMVTLLIGAGAIAGLLIYTLWQEQVSRGPKYQHLISRQSIRKIRIPPVRGRILTQDNVAITENLPSYDVVFHIHELRKAGRWKNNHPSPTTKNVMAKIEQVAAIIGRPVEVEWQAIETHKNIYPAIPFRAFARLTDVELARLQSAVPGIGGMEIRTGMIRTYPMGEAGAQLIGFVARPDPKPEEVQGYSYFLPELKGRSGMELKYDDTLSGKGGMRIVRVDSQGFYHEDLDGKNGVAHPMQMGYDMVLTVDSRAQMIAQNVMTGKRGALVMVDVRNGAVLAMVSAPSYDLNNMTGARYSALLRDSEGLPLLNRAIAGGYMPGSIVKPLVGLCLLENGMGADTEIHCPGYLLVGKRDQKIKCTHVHGDVAMVEAVATSCNTFFMAAGINAGIDVLSPFYAASGVGRRLGFEMRMSGSDGTLPSPEILRRRNQRDWRTGDTALVSMGQGFISVSPLHAAVFTAAIANGGTVFRPYLVQGIKHHGGPYVQVSKREVLSNLPVSPINLEVIQMGMKDCVYGEDGTAPLARTDSIRLAGKTGTAELGNDRKNTWFICYGPAQNPKYAMAVLVEDGEYGGTTAAPVARRFFDAWLGPHAEVGTAQR
jgi:penicillin-binding protein 2